MVLDGFRFKITSSKMATVTKKSKILKMTNLALFQARIGLNLTVRASL
jgi:hypothetical protein